MQRLAEVVTLYAESLECNEAKFKDTHELQMPVAYSIGDRDTEDGCKRYEKAMSDLKKYVILNKAPEERWYGLQVRTHLLPCPGQRATKCVRSRGGRRCGC